MRARIAYINYTTKLRIFNILNFLCSVVPGLEYLIHMGITDRQIVNRLLIWLGLLLIYAAVNLLDQIVSGQKPWTEKVSSFGGLEISK